MTELTALSAPMSIGDTRHRERSCGLIVTSRLRTEATDHLLGAGRAVGARRFVAQSFGALRFARADSLALTEQDPLDPVLAGVSTAGIGGARLSGAGGHDDRVGRGPCVALRRLYGRDRYQPRCGCADGGGRS